MGNTLVELGKDIRKRNAAGLMKRLAPEIAEIRADFERQLAEKDAEIAEIRADFERQLAEKDAEIANLKTEIVTLEAANAELAKTLKAIQSDTTGGSPAKRKRSR